MEELVIKEREDPAGGVLGGYVIIAMLGLAFGSTQGVRLLRAPFPVERTEERTVVHRRLPRPKAAARPPGAAGPIRPAVRAYRPVRHPYFRDPLGIMRGFFEALAEGDAGLREGPVRAVYFSNSEIGFDRVTSQMRRMLQARFGDGGKGFIAAAPGWRYQRHRDIIWERGGTWKTEDVLDGRLPDGRYGLGGVRAVNDGPAWIRFATLTEEESLKGGYYPFPAGTRFERFQLFYQAFPGGGDVRVEIDGGSFVDTVRTTGFEIRDRVFTAELEDAPHTVRVFAEGVPSHLYGAVFERREGFVLDAVMVVGAWADTQHNYDEEHLKRQISLRRPDLVVFQWGAKELMRNTDMGERQVRAFRRAYAKSIRRTMAGTDRGTSCLVVSPKDMGMRDRNLIVSRPAVRKLVGAAEAAARDTGCAFIDLFTAMGGEGSMRRWYESEPRMVSPDLGHILKPGAIHVGNLLGAMLLDGFRQHQRQTGGGSGPPSG